MWKIFVGLEVASVRTDILLLNTIIKAMTAKKRRPGPTLPDTRWQYSDVYDQLILTEDNLRYCM